MMTVEETFRTGLKEFRTPLSFDVQCDDERMLSTLREIGGVIEYANERSVYMVLDDIRVSIGHNWFDQKYVMVSQSGISNDFGLSLENKVAQAINNL